ncbi:hypothetical protein V1512DRAFT_277761 [Lipomyces arxii]|uniref:uncharacterized protein n=1 Tax=Lipomyces arxii TaxID=56418 RepID=UPI0034CE6E3E
MLNKQNGAMSSDQDSFSINDDSQHRSRKFLERSLSHRLDRSLQFDDDDDDTDEEFMDGMSSLLLGEEVMDEEIDNASRELDAVLNDVESSFASIELGRGGSPVSPEELLGSARKTSQRLSPRDENPTSPSLYAKPSRRAFSQATPKRTGSLGIIAERSQSDQNRIRSPDQNRIRSPAESRFAGRKPQIARAAPQRQYKSTTQDLLMSLGIGSTGPEIKQRRRPREQASSGDEPSVRLPDITGITSLISSDDYTGMSARHKNIGSIPISDDDKEILNALRTMQERIRDLEDQNAEHRTNVSNMKENLRKTQREYTSAVAKTRILEEQLNEQRREQVGSITPRDKLKIQQALEKERKSWQDKQSALKHKIESLQREMNLQNLRFARVEEERNEAVKALTEALEEIEHLKDMNSILKSSKHDSDEFMSAKQRIMKEARPRRRQESDSTEFSDDEEETIRRKPLHARTEPLRRQQKPQNSYRRQSRRMRESEYDEYSDENYFDDESVYYTSDTETTERYFRSSRPRQKLPQHRHKVNGRKVRGDGPQVYVNGELQAPRPSEQVRKEDIQQERERATRREDVSQDNWARPKNVYRKHNSAECAVCSRGKPDKTEEKRGVHIDVVF